MHFVRRHAITRVLGTLLIVAATPAHAQTFSTFFGATTGGGFTCSHPTNPSYCAGTSNTRPAPFILTVGDYWNQTINNSGLASVSQLTVNLNLSDVLFGASSMQFAVLLNGTVVGNTASFTSSDGFDLNAPYMFNFAAVTASTYDVRVRVSVASVPSGETQGMGLYTDGPSTIQLRSASIVTPEPATSALMLVGLGVVGVLARRRALLG